MKKEAIDLKESWEVYVGEFGGGREKEKPCS